MSNPRLPIIWRRALLATAGLWALVLVLGVLAAGTFPSLEPVGVAAAPGFPGWPPPDPAASGWPLVRTLLQRFDALWYLAIARDGYPTTIDVPQAAAFFPAYPLAVRATSMLIGGRTLAAATLVSTAATVACFAGVQALVAQLRARSSTGSADPTVQLQRRAVLALLLFPTSFFLLAPYSESLFLATSLWALVLAGRRQPAAAFLLAAIAGAARPVGALLAIPLLFGVVALREGGSPVASWARDRVLPAAGAGAGVGAVLVYGWIRWGDPLAPLTAQSAWSRGWAWPWDTLVQAVRFSFGDLGAASSGYQLLDLVLLGVAVLGLSTLVVTHRRDRLALALVLHGAANVLVWLVQPFDGRPLLSVPRFALVVPGVVAGLAVLTRRAPFERAWTVLSAVLLATHLLLFTRWWYVF